MNYMIDFESRDSLLNMKKFEEPFNYKLKIATDVVGETEEKTVDLVETFNYLIGLNVSSYAYHKGLEVIEGINRDEKKILVIWRDKDISNEQLNSFVEKMQIKIRDMEFDLIYVNRDNNLENIRTVDDRWKVRLIDSEFHRLMFEA